MKIFEVLLSKSYIVRIKAESAEFASEFSQIYTSDIKDSSTKQEQKINKFEFEEIECTINDVFEVQEIYEEN